MAKKSLIRLADNPFEEEELPIEEEPEVEDDLEAGMYSMAKGRRMRGPRVKLSANDVNATLASVEKALADNAEITATLAGAVSKLGKGVVALLSKEDEDDDDKDDSKKDKARASKQFESDTSIGGDKSEGEDRGRVDDETMNDPGLQDPKGATEMKGGKVAKDDAASSFGEKDDDMPGNRELSPDDKDKDAGEILVQGDAGDGPGTQVSAALKADLDQAVSSVFAKHGIIKKAAGPMTGSGSPEGNVPDVDSLFAQARNMSFKELNDMRVQAGELSGGLI